MKKGIRLRAHLEDLGFIVFADPPTGHRVRLAKNSVPVAYYDTTEDGAYRHGWVEHADGKGRTDCLSWPDLDRLLKATYPVGVRS